MRKWKTLRLSEIDVRSNERHKNIPKHWFLVVSATGQTYESVGKLIYFFARGPLESVTEFFFFAQMLKKTCIKIFYT